MRLQYRLALLYKCLSCISVIIKLVSLCSRLISLPWDSVLFSFLWRIVILKRSEGLNWNVQAGIVTTAHISSAFLLQPTATLTDLRWFESGWTIGWAKLLLRVLALDWNVAHHSDVLLLDLWLVPVVAPGIEKILLSAFLIASTDAILWIVCAGTLPKCRQHFDIF
jgi:hypothetical protein